MSRLIAKGLRGGSVRFVICTGGIAVSTMLVLVLFAAYGSVSAGIVQFMERRGLDLWIAPRGTDNLIRASGFIGLADLDEIRTMHGVSRVDPIRISFVTAEANGKRLTLMGIGFRAPHGLGGPPIIQSGRAPRSSEEIALDRSAAHRLGVGLGDVVTISHNEVRVAGLTSGTNLLATQFVFGNVNAGAAATLPIASFGIVEVAAGTSVEELAARIRKQFPDHEVMSRDVFKANNLREIAAGFRPLLLLISVLGIASAALLVAFLIEGMVEERRGELAVLLAAGARPMMIGAGLMIHSAKLLVAGIASGALLAHLLAVAIDRMAPVIPLAYSLRDLVAVAALLSVSATASALVPLIRLKDIDPLEAFRS